MADSPLVLWGAVLTNGRELPRSRVEVHAGRITSIEPSERPLHADVTVDDGWIAPGLVDLQVNGAGGVDLTSAPDPEAALAHVARALAEHGVTSFCPTVVSSPPDLIVDRLTAYAPQRITKGAQSLGAHVEGPFISPERRGVHDPHILRLASRAEIERWLSVGRPAIVTLAPELPGALDAIQQLARAGVVVSLGHSGADAETARTALAAGASMGTHLFNAMPPIHHRRPGLVGALLASEAVLSLITDGVHLDPLVADLAIRCASPDRVALVSDALSAAAAPAGRGALGDQTVVSDGRAVRREDGTLAGSALLLDGCLRNAREWLRGLSAADVLRMATQTPARAVGAPAKGRVAVGADADLIVLDRDWNVRTTFVGGEIVQHSGMEVRS